MSTVGQTLMLSDFSKICRTCLSEGELQTLYENPKSNSLVENNENGLITKLMSCTFLQFAKDDGLPEQVCLKCIKEINISYDFVKKCEVSDSILRDCLKNFHNKLSANTNISKLVTESNTTKDLPASKSKELFVKNNTEILQNEEKFIIKENNDILENEINGTENIYLNDTVTQESEIKFVSVQNKAEKTIENETIIEFKSTNEYKIEFKMNDSSKEMEDTVLNNSKVDFDSQSINIESDDIFDEIEYLDDEYETSYAESDHNYSNIKINKFDSYVCGKEQLTNKHNIGKRKKCSLTKKTKEEMSSIHENDNKTQIVQSKTLTKTKAKQRRNKNHTCTICSKSFRKCHELKLHMRTHSGEKPYQCEVCTQKFSLKRNMERHMMIHTGERPYNCHLCDKAFIQSISLHEHLRTHSGETPFVCFCGKSFIRSGELRLHLKKHTNQKGDHKCNICQSTFLTKAVLKRHELIHGEKKFLCSDCGKSFSSPATLYTHSKIHTGIKPFTCTVCGKSFTHNGTLKSHILTHTGEKPYICDICNKGFTQKSHLKYHIRGTHNGKRPYCCTVCGKSFAYSNNLKVHLRIHTGETPYICSICDKGFVDSSSMKKHQKNCNFSNT